MKIYFFLILFVIFNTQSLATPLTDKWSTKTRKAIVFIEVPVTDQENGGIDKQIGTGFIVSEEGYLLTANHLFAKWFEQPQSQKEKNIIYGRVTGNTSTEVYPLEFIGDTDSVGDVALLKLKSPPKKFQPLPVCFSSNISEGMDIVAYGFPLGEDLQSTSGTIGHKNGPDGRYSVESNFTNGMSGGPVLNKDGVIGIIKGGIQNETAIRWVTPILLAKNLVNRVQNPSYCPASTDEIVKYIIDKISFNGSTQEERITIDCPDKFCTDYYYSVTSPSLPSVIREGEDSGAISIPYNCTVTKEHCINWGNLCSSRRSEEPAEVSAKWSYNNEDKIINISSIEFNGHQARNCGKSIVDRLNRLNGKQMQ